MMRLLRESNYRGSSIQIYERPCRSRDGMECIVLIDWMDMTSNMMIIGDPRACERQARKMVDDFLESRKPAAR